ncbi:phosphatidate cytidylyltransferase [Paraflavisolibacter sp. H34]|uniref:phosphatidate cytidylyltransferase n=1 Tax=Huijunlia imazamoxiresistens TaxID=3127457 RepID=UPI0030199D0F
MAFNWQTFRTRALTSVVFVGVMMGGLLWDRWSYFILFSVVHFGCWWEYQKLVGLFDPDYRDIIPAHRYGIMFAGWLILVYFTNAELVVGGVHINHVGFWLGLALCFILPVIILFQSRRFFLKNIGYSVFGLLYISLSLGFMVDLRNHWSEDNYQLNLTLPLLIIFTLWLSDTGAYLVGSLIGRTPFSPISPKKTWEGTIGGIVLAIAIMSLAAHLTQRLPVVHAAVIAALASISGTYGDLFESKLKRMAGVKDSGRIMPGHGGFLDRFDSLLFASMLVWFYVELFM